MFPVARDNWLSSIAGLVDDGTEMSTEATKSCDIYPELCLILIHFYAVLTESLTTYSNIQVSRVKVTEMSTEATSSCDL